MSASPTRDASASSISLSPAPSASTSTVAPIDGPTSSSHVPPLAPPPVPKPKESNGGVSPSAPPSSDAAANGHAPKSNGKEKPTASAQAPAADAASSWETGFVWAFLSKFRPDWIGQQGMDTVMDLESALHAEGPTDVLIFLLQKFIQTFRPSSQVTEKTLGRHLLRTVDECLIQMHCISSYHPAPEKPSDHISYLHNKDDSTDPERMALNPLRKLYLKTRADGEPSEHGKGAEDIIGSRFWMMDWIQRLKLLRQMVDWQLSYVPAIKDHLNRSYKLAPQKKTDRDPATNPLIVEPLGLDRKKRRYWVFDDSARVYTSSNPYKKRCDLLPASSDKASLEKLIVELKGSPLGPSPDAAANSEAAVAPPFKKKAKKDPEEEAKSKERKIAKYLEEEQLPKVEKQLAKIERSKKKANLAAIAAAQAEVRTTRTRTRQKRGVNYNNGSEEEDSGDDPDDFINDAGSEEDEDSRPRRSSRAGRGTRASSTTSSSQRSPSPDRRRSSRASARSATTSAVAATANASGRGTRRSARGGGDWEDFGGDGAVDPYEESRRMYEEEQKRRAMEVDEA